MTKKSVVVIALFLLFSVFSGCSTGSSANSNYDQQLACVEIYSTNDQELIGTIEDKEALTTFNEKTLFAEQWNDMDESFIKQQAEIQKELEKYTAQYIFISYKTPVAIINDGALEKVLEITVYNDTNIIKVQISADTVKNISVPSEYLTSYFKTSDEVITYLHSLV